MTQEQKELLLKDLSARLPYGIKLLCPDDFGGYTSILEEIDIYNWIKDSEGYIYEITEVKPYLFPLSSMTEEQLYNNPIGFVQMGNIKADRDWENITINRRAYYKLVDWLNKNHFDYRGLIDKGLAIDAIGKNIY